MNVWQDMWKLHINCALHVTLHCRTSSVPGPHPSHCASECPHSFPALPQGVMGVPGRLTGLQKDLIPKPYDGRWVAQGQSCHHSPLLAWLLRFPVWGLSSPHKKAWAGLGYKSWAPSVHMVADLKHGWFRNLRSLLAPPVPICPGSGQTNGCAHPPSLLTLTYSNFQLIQY